MSQVALMQPDVAAGGDPARKACRGCSRRQFVVRSVGALAVAMLPAACVAPVVPVAIRGGAIRVRPEDQPDLVDGGFLRLQPGGRPDPIYLLSVEGELVALSPLCTHRGCTVDVQGERLVCPCHGSTYDRRGRLLRGPAEEPLRSYPVRTESDGTITITLEAV